MSNNKQTAVEHIENAIGKYMAYYKGHSKAELFTIIELNEAVKEAKEMENQQRGYSEEDMFEFSQWVSHEDWVYLPSKGYWVNEEQEELEQKLSSKEILNIWFEQFKKK